jgi:hypothetical protein
VSKKQSTDKTKKTTGKGGKTAKKTSGKGNTAKKAVSKGGKTARKGARPRALVGPSEITIDVPAAAPGGTISATSGTVQSQGSTRNMSGPVSVWIYYNGQKVGPDAPNSNPISLDSNGQWGYDPNNPVTFNNVNFQGTCPMKAYTANQLDEPASETISLDFGLGAPLPSPTGRTK